MNNTICSLEGPGYRSMKIISAPASRDKLSSHRHDFEIMSADVACTPKIFRNRRRVAVEVEEREEWKSLPVIYIGPCSSGNQAVSEGGIPRVRDYKVTDEGTDGRTKGSRCSRAIR